MTNPFSASFLLGVVIPLTLGQWHPGDIMDTTEYTEINRALDDVMEADGQNVRIAIGVANYGPYKLINPRYHLSLGMIHSTMPIAIEYDQTGLMLFMKHSWSFSGTRGVLSYDLDDLPDFKLVIMFDTPDQDNNNKYHTKIYPARLTLEEKVYTHMRNKAGPLSPSGYVTVKEFGIEMVSTMTSNNLAKLIVWIDSDFFNATAIPALHRSCQNRGIISGDRCELECYPIGVCWTSPRCSNDQECRDLPNLECEAGEPCRGAYSKIFKEKRSQNGGFRTGK